MPCGKINVLKVDEGAGLEEGWGDVRKVCVHVFWMVNLFLYVTFLAKTKKLP